MGFLKKIINWLLNAILVVLIVASIWIFLASLPPRLLPHIPSDSMEPELSKGFRGSLETDARRTAVQPQRDALRLGRPRFTACPGRGSEAGRRAGLQLPASNGWDKIEMHILKYYIKRCISLPGEPLHPERCSGSAEPTHAIGNLDSQRRIRQTLPENFRTASANRFPRSTPSPIGTSGISVDLYPKTGDSLTMNRKLYLIP